MRISYPSSLALVLVPCLAGCASQKFKVFVDPAHVAVQSVSIDGRTANVQYMAMDNLPSGVIHSVPALSSFARARPTFSRISSAAFIQTIGLGLSLWLSM